MVMHINIENVNRERYSNIKAGTYYLIPKRHEHIYKFLKPKKGIKKIITIPHGSPVLRPW